MRTILLATATFTAAGAGGGGFYEASALRHFHARYGLPMPLQDWVYDAINAVIFGAVGFVVGIVLGAVLDRLIRRRQSAAKPKANKTL
jgi:predicted ABC-type sugar transport system permease subunit